MYLRKLHLRNLKRVRELSLDFEHEDLPRMWTVLIGENGTAKTTILQAVAMAAAGSRQVNTLARPVARHLRDRRGDDGMAVEAEFSFSERAHSLEAAFPAFHDQTGLLLRSTIALKPGSTSVEAHSHFERGGQELAASSGELDDARATHRPHWFIAGYGISRNLPESSYTPNLDAPSIDRLLPLFDSRIALASSSFANHFAKKDIEEGRKSGTTSLRYAKALNQAIKLGGVELFPEIMRLELRGQGGAKHAASLIDSDRFYQRMGQRELAVSGVALSHGYQSTFAWIADLIGHVMLEAKTEVSTTEMEGLVLIDEIDLYLHPAWQARFVSALRRVFPRMQFVATTHSPVVLAALEPHEIVRLIIEPVEGDVVRGGWSSDGELVPARHADPDQPDPRPMTGSEIYRTFFGLEGLTLNPHGEDLRRYQVLADDPAPTEADRKELAELRAKLTQAGISLPERGPEQ